MAPRQVTKIGTQLLDECDAQCRAIVREMAACVLSNARHMEVSAKPSYSGRPGGDVKSSAGLAAQALFVQLAAVGFSPRLGYIGEEGLRRRSRLSSHAVATVDPDDGTGALIRAIRAGRLPVPGEVASMLGLQINGEAIAAYICDVSSGVLVTRAPYGDRVLRIEPSSVARDISALSRVTSIRDGILLHHTRREPSSNLTRRLMTDGTFGQVIRESNSMGLSLVRLLTGDFAAMLRPAGTYWTPWDDTPIWALCAVADIAILRVDGGVLREFKQPRLDRIQECEQDVFYIPRTQANMSILREFAPVKLLR